MENDQSHNLEARIDRLERSVEEIRRMVEQLQPESTSDKAIEPIRKELPRPSLAGPPPPPPPRPHAKPEETESRSTSVPPPRPTETQPSVIMQQMRTGEFWLNKVGIGLLLFALVFFFKYSIDQGWLTPPIRIIIGLLVGAILLFFGLRVYDRRRHYALVLLGGSIAVFYISGYAAFQLFALVPFGIAMTFMVGVTALAFALSLRQDEAILSLIGTLGGLGTPFLLYTGEANVPGLTLYTCLLLAGTMSVFFMKGWRTLLWVALIGGWAVMALAYGDDAGGLTVNHPWSLQLGFVFIWLCYWLVPIVREVLRAKNPETWPQPLADFSRGKVIVPLLNDWNTHAHVFSVSAIMVTLGMSLLFWSSEHHETIGWVTMAVSMLYLFVARRLWSIESLRKLAETQIAVMLALFTSSLALILDGDTLFVALACEAGVLHLISMRLSSKRLTLTAHALSGVVGLMLFQRLTEGGKLGWSSHTMADLWAIVMACAVAVMRRQGRARSAYFIATAVGLALLFYREFDGNTLLVTLTAEAVLLHLLARRISDEVIGTTAHIFTGSLFLWSGYRLVSSADGVLLFNQQALADLGFLASLLIASSQFRSMSERKTYLSMAHAIVLLWLLREMSVLENGQGWVSAAWGGYAIGLLLLGLRFNRHSMRQVALLTLLILVAKLFVIDLAAVEMIWRVLIFSAFGALFLLLSYYFKTLWKANPEESAREDKAQPSDDQ